MAKPTDRESFKRYCLRKLGDGVITVNVSDEQVDDRIDEAIGMWNLYHYEGFVKTYLKHEITQEEIDNMAIEVGEEIQDIVGIFNIGSVINSGTHMFNVAYQFALNDITGLRHAGSLTNFHMAKMHMENIEKVLGGATPIQFHSSDNRLILNTSPSKLSPGMFIIMDAYVKVNPDNSRGAWQNAWLQKYATALIKLQWGTNLTKVIGMTMPGGVQLNGDMILRDAIEEVKLLEEEVRDKLAPGAYDMIG